MAKKVLILGGRRGLGEQIVNLWKTSHPQDEVVVTSRKSFVRDGVASLVCDFAKELELANILQWIEQESPQRIFCIVGGGPYGPYEKKEWKDHQWALQVSLLGPMQIIHRFLKNKNIEQCICVGSAIAENAADPWAASYAAAKHGLYGLIRTLRQESARDLRLFSPGYMNTDMIPAEKLKKQQLPVLETELVAQEFVNWALDPEAPWHWQGRRP